MKPFRILLVDDEPQTRSSLATWLFRCGFAVVAVEGPAPADRALGTEDFDLILSDVFMPGNDRLQWIQRRLASDSLPPVLLMTGSPDLENAMRAANLPVAGYILKPLDYLSVRSRIERLAGEHRRRSELLSLSHEVLRLLALRIGVPAGEPDPFADQLHHLACELSTEAQRRPRENPSFAEGTRWRDALVDTILVLDQHRTDTPARELELLRQRLAALVDPALLADRVLSSAASSLAFDPSHN